MADKMGNEKQDLLDGALNELAGAFEENVTIKKYASAGTNPLDLQTPSIVYTLINTTAVVDDIGIELLKASDGVFAAGDLQFQIRTVKIHEPTVTPYHPGDRIVYEDVEYRLVQKPQTEFLGGIIYYTCVARRISD